MLNSVVVDYSNEFTFQFSFSPIYERGLKLWKSSLKTPIKNSFSGRYILLSWHDNFVGLMHVIKRFSFDGHH